jgi:P27 family predicted phage terminase small subunit
MGRPPTPTAIKLMTGGHYRTVNKDEPKPSATAKCPRSLSPEARKHWRRLTKFLVPLGLCSSADQDNLAILSTALARWVKAQEQIARSGEVVAVRGKPQVNPWIAIARDCEATISRIGGEFGLSPVARCRLYASAAAPIPAAPPADTDIADSYFSDEPIN